MTPFVIVSPLVPHPLAALIPPMSVDEFEALKVDIDERGQLEPIVLYEGMIIDGRHRSQACRELGIEPTSRSYTGDDPVGYVVSLNVHRRHLSASQRGVVGLAVERAYAVQAKERQGARNDLVPNMVAIVPPCSAITGATEFGRARDKAAHKVGVSPRTISDAKAVERDAADLLPLISSGEMTLPQAKREIRQRAKSARVAEIGRRDPAPITSMGPFPILYADPPWRYEHSHPTTAIENNYPTMTLDDIKALAIPASDDAVLFLWATSPMLANAVEVMKAWGFDYRTCVVWVKDRIGMGYYVRQQHELLLIGHRGRLPVPDPEDRPSSVINAARGAHSVKPEEGYEIVERMYPLLERVELFARRPRDGWAAWGNEVVAA